MSGLDQPIVIAQSGYHVGHQRSIRAAEEQGYFKDEGLERYVYDQGGLIPGEWEALVLGRQMWERGVDIATAVNVWSAVAQRARGEDVFVVGGWRTQLASKLVAAKGVTRPEQLKGARSILRERGGMHTGVEMALRQFGVDPEDIEWVQDSVVAYNSGSTVGDLLRSGQVTLLSINGPEADRLISEGYPLILDLEDFYHQRGAWPPGRVIVATGQTIEHRGEELRAFLRANLRGFWFVEDPRNHESMYDLETRMRQTTFNEDERKLRMLRDRAPSQREGPRRWGPMVMDGLVTRAGLAGVIEMMVHAGQIQQPIDVDDVLKDAASIDAYENLVSRRLINAQEVQEWRKIRG